VVRRIRERGGGGGGGWVVIHGILDSRQLDVQAFHFKLTISHHVDAMMREAFDVNLVT